MSDITLTSKEYCESVFVDGPKFNKLSAFVSGPEAQVQDKLHFISEDAMDLVLGPWDWTKPSNVSLAASDSITSRAYTTRICAGNDTADIWDNEIKLDNEGVKISTLNDRSIFIMGPLSFRESGSSSSSSGNAIIEVCRDTGGISDFRMTAENRCFKNLYFTE